MNYICNPYNNPNHINLNQGNGKYCIYNDRPDLAVPIVLMTYYKYIGNQPIHHTVNVALPTNQTFCFGAGGDVIRIMVRYSISAEENRLCSYSTKSAPSGDYTISQIITYGQCIRV
jgi:hypothetical protein